MITEIPLSCIDPFLNGDNWNKYNKFFNISKAKFIEEDWEIKWEKYNSFTKIYIELECGEKLYLGVIRQEALQAGKYVKTIDDFQMEVIKICLEEKLFYIKYMPYNGFHKSCFHLLRK